MNKVGLFYTYWSNEWLVDFEQTAKRISKAGFDIMEINLVGGFHELSKQKKVDFKSLIDDLGLGITCCLGLKPEQDFSSPDKKVRDAGVAYVRELIEDCRFLNSPVVAGMNYAAWPAAPPAGTIDKRPFVERSIESVAQLMDMVEDYGIIYAIEVVNRFESFLVNDAQEAIAFCKAVGSPNCMVHLDTFHMNIEEDSFRDAILMCKGKLGHFHLGEANRKPPGQGRLPWDEIFKSLKEIEYQGALVMESFMKIGGEVSRNVSLWRDLSLDADDYVMSKMVETACNFVHEKMA